MISEDIYIYMVIVERNVEHLEKPLLIKCKTEREVEIIKIQFASARLIEVCMVH